MRFIKPTIKLIDCTIPYLGFYTWLKSRQWVVEDNSGSKFMLDLELSPDWYSKIPEEFKVGSESVSKDKYLTRINCMNLQYNNMETYVYEINGSCLFRDFLYNISKIAAWAQSNRFLFSIYGPESIYDEDNYPVSSEYKGIPEWDEQFMNYMDAIKSDPIVDHNRLEMPYSISSTFWIGVNKKTILDIVSFLRKYSPFLYDIYGVKFGVPEYMIPKEPSAALTQYILKDADSFKEGSLKFQGTQLVNTKMALILYSQFIRQADTKISGLFNHLIHNDAEEFSHKVFKGGTVLNVHYVADIDKVMSTVKTRLCAFAMSSGTGPESWSYFLNNFIPDNIKPEEFMKYLPCKFHGCKLVDCKFYDDVKFRNEGKEVSNCPCPIFSQSMVDAKAKKVRDNNKIGDAYYDLVQYLNSSGLTKEFKLSAWTSDLSIRTELELPQEIKVNIESALMELEDEYNKLNKTDKSTHIGLRYGFELSSIKDFFPEGDVTCAMKGSFIDYVHELLHEYGLTKYIINFGGDMLIRGINTVVNIDESNFNIEVTDDRLWSIFTSGNTKKRGDHIDGCVSGYQVTVVVKWKDPSSIFNSYVDVMATKVASGKDVENISRLIPEYGGLVNTPIWVDTNSGNLLNLTYVASPFFNELQIKVRDAMQSKLDRSFRPDLTEASKIYDVNKTEETVYDVVSENISGINQSQFLVYPSRTTDLGTLWELGYAMSLSHPVIKYDEENESYTFEFLRDLVEEVEVTKEPYLFDCTSKMDVISMGYLGNRVDPDDIYYQLKGMNDNIMLSVQYHHVEYNKDGDLIEYERDKEDSDK